MKNNFVFILMFFLIGLVSANLYYEVDVRVNGDEVFIDSIDLIYSRHVLSNLVLRESYSYYDPYFNESYIFYMHDSNSESIYSEEFYFPNFYILYYENISSEIVYYDKFNFSVYLPYYEDAENFVIKDYDGEVVSEGHVFSFDEKVFDDKDDFVLDEEVDRSLFYVILFLILIGVLIFVLVVLFFRNK